MSCLPHFPVSDMKGLVSILPHFRVSDLRSSPSAWPERFCLPNLPLSDLRSSPSVGPESLVSPSSQCLIRKVLSSPSTISECQTWEILPGSDQKGSVFPNSHCQTWVLPVSDLKALSPPSVWPEKFSQCRTWKPGLPQFAVSDQKCLHPPLFPSVRPEKFSQCLTRKVLSSQFPTVRPEKFSQCRTWKPGLPQFAVSDQKGLVFTLHYFRVSDPRSSPSVWPERFCLPTLPLSDLRSSPSVGPESLVSPKCLTWEVLPVSPPVRSVWSERSCLHPPLISLSVWSERFCPPLSHYLT